MVYGGRGGKLADLRRRHPIKTAERADGSVQFFNNSDLAIVLAH